jgi:hypothetical protein
MKLKNSKNNYERSVAIFEILLMTLSIISFSYLIGGEIELVSADPRSIIGTFIPGKGLVLASGSGTSAAAATATTSVASSTITAATPAATIIPAANPFYTRGAVTVLTNVGPEAGYASSAANAMTAAASGNAGAAQAALETSSALTDPFASQIMASGNAASQASSAAKAATFGQKALTATQQVIGNAVVALGLYFAIKYISGIWLDEQNANDLAKDVAISYGVGAVTAPILSALGFGNLGSFASWLVNPIGNPLFGGWVTVTPLGLIGLGVGVIWFLHDYTKTRYYLITYNCYGWQPESGGQHCEECNEGQFPCTEYRCESLGRSCKLLNVGSTEEKCVWDNRNDISPPEISSWNVPLDQEKFQYVPDTATLPATLPGDKGVIIKYKSSGDGCMPPFTRLKFGVTLNKVGTCRIDTTRTADFDSMGTLLSNGFYIENHTIQVIHAGTTELENEGIGLDNGGNYEIFVRCESENGYSNDGTFVFKYCINDEPDREAPRIELTNPLNNRPIPEGQTSMPISIYTDKPSDCKWSHTDEDYDTMTNTMSCAKSITEINANMLYQCTTTLDGLRDSTENKFYFRCKSYPANEEADRYENQESYPYTLIGTKALIIDSIKPNSTTIIDSTESVPVTIDVKTSAGYNKGDAACYLKTSSSTGSYILFANTDSYQHTQELWLTEGDYNYDIRCCDLGGNCDSDSIEFSVETDFEAPAVVRIYNEGSSLKLATNEKAECVYDTTSCNYAFDNGIKISSSDNLEHTTEWNTENTFYIKCKDEFEGQPAGDECTIIVRPSDTF